MVISPLRRAQASAQPFIDLLNTGNYRYEIADAEINNGAREREYGVWDGKIMSELDAAERTKAEKYYYNKDNNVRPLHGESNVDLLKRVKPWLEELNTRYRGKTVVLFGHARQLSAVGLLSGYDTKRMVGLDRVINLQRMTLPHSVPINLSANMAMNSGAILKFVETPGGIDLNSANLAMTIKRDGKGVPLPFSQQDFAQLSKIDGFIPRITEIRSALGLPIFKELEQLSHP